ncbi:MAG: hypothetical protein KDB60_20850, partial [Propionibacteriaceae bacterium]|nr:hypothetical protein [Propionibacteriaceae bacterium]
NVAALARGEDKIASQNGPTPQDLEQLSPETWVDHSLYLAGPPDTMKKEAADWTYQRIPTNPLASSSLAAGLAV